MDGMGTCTKSILRELVLLSDSSGDDNYSVPSLAPPAFPNRLESAESMRSVGYPTSSLSTSPQNSPVKLFAQVYEALENEMDPDKHALLKSEIEDGNLGFHRGTTSKNNESMSDIPDPNGVCQIQRTPEDSATIPPEGPTSNGDGYKQGDQVNCSAHVREKKNSRGFVKQTQKRSTVNISEGIPGLRSKCAELLASARTASLRKQEEIDFQAPSNGHASTSRILNEHSEGDSACQAMDRDACSTSPHTLNVFDTVSYEQTPSHFTKQNGQSGILPQPASTSMGLSLPEDKFEFSNRQSDSTSPLKSPAIAPKCMAQMQSTADTPSLPSPTPRHVISTSGTDGGSSAHASISDHGALSKKSSLRTKEAVPIDLPAVLAKVESTIRVLEQQHEERRRMTAMVVPVVNQLRSLFEDEELPVSCPSQHQHQHVVGEMHNHRGFGSSQETSPHDDGKKERSALLEENINQALLPERSPDLAIGPSTPPEPNSDLSFSIAPLATGARQPSCSASTQTPPSVNTLRRHASVGMQSDSNDASFPTYVSANHTTFSHSSKDSGAAQHVYHIRNSNVYLTHGSALGGAPLSTTLNAYQGDTRTTPTKTNSTTESPESAPPPRRREASRIGITNNAVYSTVDSPSVQDSDLLTPLPGKTPLLHLDDVSTDLAGTWEMSGVDSSPSLAGHSWATRARQDLEANNEVMILRRESFPPTKLWPRTGAHTQVAQSAGFASHAVPVFNPVQHHTPAHPFTPFDPALASYQGSYGFRPPGYIARMPLEQLLPRGSIQRNTSPVSGAPLARRAAPQTSRPRSFNVEMANSVLASTISSRVDERLRPPSDGHSDVRPGFLSTSSPTNHTRVKSVARSNTISSVIPVHGQSNIGPVSDCLTQHGGSEVKQYRSVSKNAESAQSAKTSRHQANGASNKEDMRDHHHAPVLQVSDEPPVPAPRVPSWPVRTSTLEMSPPHHPISSHKNNPTSDAPSSTSTTALMMSPLPNHTPIDKRKIDASDNAQHAQTPSSIHTATLYMSPVLYPSPYQPVSPTESVPAFSSTPTLVEPARGFTQPSPQDYASVETVATSTLLVSPPTYHSPEGTSASISLRGMSYDCTETRIGEESPSHRSAHSSQSSPSFSTPRPPRSSQNAYRKLEYAVAQQSGSSSGMGAWAQKACNQNHETGNKQVDQGMKPWLVSSMMSSYESDTGVPESWQRRWDLMVGRRQSPSLTP